MLGVWEGLVFEWKIWIFSFIVYKDDFRENYSNIWKNT